MFPIGYFIVFTCHSNIKITLYKLYKNIIIAITNIWKHLQLQIYKIDKHSPGTIYLYAHSYNNTTPFIKSTQSMNIIYNT